jgi:FtsH-binding integral membrane protein
MLGQVCVFVATLLFGVYLAYDTQDILKKYNGDNEFAYLQIYIDIARLFLTILAMLGKSRKNKYYI